ncbi:MAG: glycine cleavage system protein H [Vicinamibacteraceae bacterium]|nr:glycine cleavage system protein H [Vicinamibacteraceae bacterium]
MPHDILTLYSSKALEYGIAISFLVLFIPFWRFVMKPAPAPAAARVAERPRVPVAEAVEWFQFARDVGFHPGHAWARFGQGALATVGMDDFARQLVGSQASLELPPPGTTLVQGEPAWSLRNGDRQVAMLSPVDGVVTEVNPAVGSTVGSLGGDPFGTGWLMQVEVRRPAANERTLLSGDAARAWLQTTTDALRMRIAPDMGLVMQDGGTLVDGLARAIDEDNWDAVAREFLRS